MPTPNHERQQMVSNPPTAKQLAYLRALADRAGQAFAWPQTSWEASGEIRKLRAAQPVSRVERTIEHRETADAIAAGPADSSRVRDEELIGWGSTARWSHGS
jgi:hypothetical protein